MKPSVVGLMGCGIWGKNILRELLFLGADVHVVDPDPTAREAAKAMGATLVLDSIQSLQSLDGYIISSPASLHREHIEALSTYAKPIFTEKPFVLNLEDALHFKESGFGEIFVMHVWRYHPAVQALKTIAADKRIGDLEMIRTFRCNWTSPRKDVDPIWTLLPHDISIFTELTGSVPSATFAHLETCKGKPVGMMAGTQGTCPCVAEVSSRHPHKTRQIRLHGTEGVAIMNTDESKIEIHTGDANSSKPESEIITVSAEPALRLEVAAFLDYLHGGRQPRTCLTEAVEITRTLVDLRKMAGLPG